MMGAAAATANLLYEFNIALKNEAKLMLARAERLEKKMLVLKERAYELDPDLKPKKGRPKKTSEEA